MDRDNVRFRFRAMSLPLGRVDWSVADSGYSDSGIEIVRQDLPILIAHPSRLQVRWGMGDMFLGLGWQALKPERCHPGVKLSQQRPAGLIRGEYTGRLAECMRYGS